MFRIGVNGLILGGGRIFAEGKSLDEPIFAKVHSTAGIAVPACWPAGTIQLVDSACRYADYEWVLTGDKNEKKLRLDKNKKKICFNFRKPE